MIRQFEPSFDEEDARAVADVIHSGYINEHKMTREFERIFAEFVGAKYAVTTTNGTIALFLALKTLNIGYGDKVIMPVYTAIGTASALRLAGATPVFVDVDLQTGNMDFRKLDWYKRDEKVKAVVPVHMNGRACFVEETREVALMNGWHMIEDAAQCLGSHYNGKHLGTFGDVGCFSMATTKIITTGQGGVVVTDRKDLYDKLMALKDQGRVRDVTLSELPDYYPMEGYNFKFTEIQAALGLSQFRKLPERIEHKKHITNLYYELLSDSVFFPPKKDEELLWYIDVLLPKKGQNFLVKKEITAKDIELRLFYTPLHKQPQYKTDGSFPCAEEYSSRGVWLPSSSFLKDDDIEYVCTEFKGVLN